MTLAFTDFGQLLSHEVLLKYYPQKAWTYWGKWLQTCCQLAGWAHETSGFVIILKNWLLRCICKHHHWIIRLHMSYRIMTSSQPILRICTTTHLLTWMHLHALTQSVKFQTSHLPEVRSWNWWIEYFLAIYTSCYAHKQICTSPVCYIVLMGIRSTIFLTSGTMCSQ